MFGMGHKETDTTYGAIIDVGSASVGVGIVESNHTLKLPKILYVHREEMRMSEKSDTLEDALRNMRETLFSVCLRLGNDGIRTLMAHNADARIGRVLVTCSSPWSHTISRNIEYANDKPFKITESFIDELVNSAEHEAAAVLSESEIVTTLGLTIVERATINIAANGYHVTNPFDATVNNVSLSHVIGLIPESILEAIHEVQEKILTDTKLSAHTYILVMYCVLRDLYPKLSSLCIVDVTGESTEIGIVEDGVLIKTAHSPSGSNSMLREIMKKTKKSKEDIISQLRTLDENSADESARANIDTLLKTFDNELQKTLSKVFETNRIPYKIITSSQPDLQDLFAHRIPVIAHRVTGEKYSSLELQPKLLDEIAQEVNKDVFITMASRFFHKLHGCGEIETI